VRIPNPQGIHLRQQPRQQVRVNVPTEESGQAHDYAEYCGEHCQHKEPALLSQRRHCQQRDRQGQYRIGKIKLVVVKIKFVVGLIGLVSVGLLSLLFVRLLLSKRLIGFDLFLIGRFGLWRGSSSLRG
jgi:hypothetical protein